MRFSIIRFLKHEAAGGVLLVAASLLALVIANTPLYLPYQALLDTNIAVKIGDFEIFKPAVLWVNDGLMAIFFLMVGLELKRECLEGQLANPANVALPIVGAIGGMLVPALFYLALKYDNPIARQGWAIPSATDIAFALGVLALLGKRVPVAIGLFLTTLAIIDDIGAIVIIALFYTSKLSLLSLSVALGAILCLWLLNKNKVTNTGFYWFVGIIMWAALLKSGVHATLAGIFLAMFIPMQHPSRPEYSPAKELETSLHGFVAFVILPLFAFFNAGVRLVDMTLEQVFHPVALGVALGLFVGKQLGIFGLCWLCIKLKWVNLRQNMTLIQLWGVSALCGIGFTMSLFIGSLAFEETGQKIFFDERIGILIGSLLSGVMGYLILRYSLNKPTSAL